MQTYTDARRILECMGYPAFLPLQEKAFRDPALYDSEKIFLLPETPPAEKR